MMTKFFFLLRISALFVLGACLLVLASTVAGQDETFSEEQIEFFESKIRPILVERCFECHSPDADYIEGSLNLASRKAILEGGDSGAAIDLESPLESLLIDAINYGELFEMPPDSKMPQEEIDLLTKWVEMKAPWPDEASENAAKNEEFDLEARKAEHWCWQQVTTPGVPRVKNNSWPRDEIDHFILAKLEENNLTPAKPADRRTLIRRVYFDLTGLPPTPEQVQSFVEDESDNAFEKVVDQLLASPHFGERWARHWMDLIRYAETHGHEFDYPIRNAYQYRDYLIRAFNDDVPYDQFIKEHIAGDLVEEPRRHPEKDFNESILGTGFWFLGEATHGPVDVKGDEAGHIDNQIDVMSKTFLGLTVACARCHDHKFDAISIKDYYALSGFLQSSRRQDVLLDPNRAIEKAYNEIKVDVDRADELARQMIAELPTESGHDADRYMQAAIQAIAKYPGWLETNPLLIEGESLNEVSKESGKVVVQDIKPQGGTKWSGNKHLWWHGGKEGDSFVVDFEVPYSATFDVIANFTKAVDYGIAEISIDDQVVIKELDLFSKTLTTTGEQTITRQDLAQGKHRLKVKSIGTNKEAVAKFMFGIDYLRLVPLGANKAEEEKSEFLRKLATEFELDVAKLQRWITALADPAVAKRSHPMFPVRETAVRFSENNQKFDHVTNKRQYVGDVIDELDGIKTEEFMNAESDEWIRTGVAFNDKDDSIRAYTASGDRLLTKPSVPHSGRYGKRMYGVLRSPTFEIKHPYIHYRMLADNVQVRLIVDGYKLDIENPLLFAGFTFKFSSDGEYQWRTQGQDLKNYIGHRAHIEIIDHSDGFVAIDRIVFSDKAEPPADAESSPVVFEEVSDLKEFCQGFDQVFKTESSITQVELINWLAKHNLAQPKLQQLFDEANTIKQKIAKRQKNIPRPMVAIGMADGTPENEFVFIRGNHKNLGDEAPRDIITALQRDKTQLFDRDNGSGRMYLAEQIATTENPLTSRVVVNRLWHHLTGRGLVRSVDNFGVLGEKPSHPELLDYLATEFTDDGWSIKQMLKRIVMTQTYQMSSVADPKQTEQDPENILLHHFRIRRLQGEAIRDSMLSVANKLDPKMFGPSIAIHLTPFMQGRGRPGKSGPLNGLGRRSIYTEVRRNFLSPMMLAFDTPIPFNSIGRRNISNVPAQALILMNDPFVLEQAKLFAERLVAEVPDHEQRIVDAYQIAFARPPSAEEQEQGIRFLKQQAKEKSLDENEIKDNVELWTDYCHVLFNVKEFIYVR